jgi:D-alanyl-lipoteichoic acid acyltransferase DltB (MBOAT superfamily)
MVVNSLNFLLFFVVVFVVYYLPINKNTPKFQNTWLLLTSYFFYGFADWKMIPLLFGATVVYYVIGLWLKMEMEKGKTKVASNITTLGVVLGVGVLLYFKYLNFFAESFFQLLNGIGLYVSWTTLNIVLPIGISFFTFKLISYVIEIHREHIQPSSDFIEFGVYVAFFPTILSGPIDRPNKFIPQLKAKRSFNYDMAFDGSRQILWGMFTKMCIADNLAIATDSIWSDFSSQNGSTLLLMALLYPIQMYADFDGYSNMAIGVGKILGINVAKNFNHPFLARNIAEYWRNWHISLTGWLTDYVFSPLNIAFRNLNNLGIIFAILVNFVLIGLWHGANWTFAIFGLYHGLLYIPLILSGSFGKKKKLRPNHYGLPNRKDFLKMIGTYFMVSIGLIIFRATTILDAISYSKGIISDSIIRIPYLGGSSVYIGFLFAIYILIAEWRDREKDFPLQQKVGSHGFINLRLSDFIIVTLIVLFGNIDSKQFIYFQF